jgi:hypothetical protein
LPNEPTIFKYQLAITDKQVIDIHGKATQFTVGLDPFDDLCVWAVVDKSKTPTPHTFFIVGTGHLMPKEAKKWLGTVRQRQFMWHIWTT